MRRDSPRPIFANNVAKLPSRGSAPALRHGARPSSGVGALRFAHAGGRHEMKYVSARKGPLGARRSQWLGSTFLVASWLSACGAAGAQDTPPPSSPPAPSTSAPSAPSTTSPSSTTTPQSPATPPAASNPKLPPVTIESPTTRQRPAGRTPTNEQVREKPQVTRAPANPPPAAVSRPGPTPRVAQRPTPAAVQAPTAPINQSLFGGLIPAGAISASFVPQVAPGVPGPNLNAIATSATRLDLPLLQTPASVDVITAQTMQDQGYRTNTEAVAGAVGVLAFSPGGAQGGFSMRGFSSDAINHLYNGINIGIQDLTGRTQDTFSFDRIEFLKGASAIKSGVGSIGGSVNYVTKQPFSGPVRNETFISTNSFGSVRTGFIPAVQPRSPDWITVSLLPSPIASASSTTPRSSWAPSQRDGTTRIPRL